MPTQPPEATYKFFIAFASSDVDPATALADALGPETRTFVANRSVAPGERWADTIHAALSSTAITVVLISSRSGEGFYLSEEIAFAIDAYRADPNHRRVVPVVLDGSVYERADMPYGLRSLQAIRVESPPDWESVSSDLHAVADKLSQGEQSPEDPGSPRATPRAIAHILHRYPRGPFVPMQLIPPRLVLAIASLLGEPSRMSMAVAQAAAMRQEADPNDETATVVEPQDLPAPAGPARDYWWRVFTEAALHGPRMVAALLVTIDHSKLPEPARRDRDRLLAELERPADQGQEVADL